MDSVFKIEENRSRQRILLIDDDFRIFKHTPVTAEEFDAVVFLSENGTLVEQQFLHLNPLMDGPFYLKPFFINSKTVNAPFLKCASDGLSTDIDDPALVSKISDIKHRIKDLHIELSGGQLRKGEHTLLISIFRFFLSRGEIPSAILKEGSTLGYCVCFYEFFMRHNIFTLQSTILIYKEFIKNRYIAPLDIVDVAQYCKYCNHTHIIYTEICPKCGSCDIELNNMMHHFPCAHITDETEFMVDGDLICPKCSKHLHHIGVDYDRPAGIYSCNNCSASFSRSDMRGTCVYCTKVSPLDDFRTYKIYSFKFTPLGLDEVARWSIYNSNEDMSVSIGFLSINAFIAHTTNQIDICDLPANGNELTTIRIKNIQQSRVQDISTFIFDTIASAQCTFKDDHIFISLTYRDESTIEEYCRLIDEHLQKLEIDGYSGVDFSNRETNMTSADYLKHLL